MQRKSVTSKKVSGDVMLALVQQLSLKSRSKPILHHPDPFWHPDTFFHDTAGRKNDKLNLLCGAISAIQATAMVVLVKGEPGWLGAIIGEL